MFESFKKSWELTKTTFKIINKDKRLFILPLFSVFFSILFVFSLIFPALFFENNLSIITVFLFYIGVSFIATFFNVATVFLVKNIIEEKKVTLGKIFAFAFSKVGSILIWSILSATIGIILRILDKIAEKIGGIGKILIKVTTSLIGGIWAFISIFVIPEIVYKNINPFMAIKESSLKIKKTWGENIIKNIGFGTIRFLLILFGIVVGLFGVLLIPSLTIAYIFFGIVVLYLIVITLYFNVANAVFNTALYVYADTGKMPFNYSEKTAKEIFIKNKEKEM